MVNRRMLCRLVSVLTCVVWCSLVWAQGIAQGPYLGQAPPGLTLQVFAPDIISIPNRSERIGSFTPDGKEFYFTVTNMDWSGNRIMMTSQAEDGWTTPAVLPFSREIDLNVYSSPDGQRLFFNSSRPDTSWLDFNIWMCERQGSGWSDPVKLAINSTRQDFAGTCTWSGTLYFASERDGGTAIFRSVPAAGEYTTVEKLPAPVNAGRSEQCPWIAPDESYLIFASSRHGSRDLYITYRSQDDSWTEPVNLGSPVNTQDYEWFPTVSADGQYLFYSRCRDVSNIGHDLYWVRTAAFMPDPNGPIQNLSSEQRFGSIRLAIDYAAAGDLLVVQPGIYRESIILEKDIILRSVDPNDPYYVGGTIIQADLQEPVLTLGDCSPACEIAGLTLRAGSVGVLGTDTDATLRRCRIMDNLTHGVELFRGSKPHLLDCLIATNGQAGIKMHVLVGRRPVECEPLIENCYIVDNQAGSVIDGMPVIIDSVIQEQ